MVSYLFVRFYAFIVYTIRFTQQEVNMISNRSCPILDLGQLTSIISLHNKLPRLLLTAKEVPLLLFSLVLIFALLL